jgi:hypothetical protein
MAVDAVDAVFALGTTAPPDCASCPFAAIGPPRSWVEGVEPSPLCEALSPFRRAMASGEAVGRRTEVKAGGREWPARSLEEWMAVDAVNVLVALGTTAQPDCACCPFTAVGPPRSWVEGVEPPPSRPAIGVRVEPPPSRPAMELGDGSSRRSGAEPAAVSRRSSAALGSRSGSAASAGGRESTAGLLDSCDENAFEPRKATPPASPAGPRSAVAKSGGVGKSEGALGKRPISAPRRGEADAALSSCPAPLSRFASAANPLTAAGWPFSSPRSREPIRVALPGRCGCPPWTDPNENRCLPECQEQVAIEAWVSRLTWLQQAALGLNQSKSRKVQDVPQRVLTRALPTRPDCPWRRPSGVGERRNGPRRGHPQGGRRPRPSRAAASALTAARPRMGGGRQCGRSPHCRPGCKEDAGAPPRRRETHAVGRRALLAQLKTAAQISTPSRAQATRQASPIAAPVVARRRRSARLIELSATGSAARS